MVRPRVPGGQRADTWYRPAEPVPRRPHVGELRQAGTDHRPALWGVDRDWSTGSAGRHPRFRISKHTAECPRMDRGDRFVRPGRVNRVRLGALATASIGAGALVALGQEGNAAGPDVHLWEPVHAERQVDL